MSQYLAATDLCYLCACAVNGKIPDARQLTSDTETLYAAADHHLLVCAVGMALESAGIHSPKFTQAIAQAQRKNALLDADRAAVLAELEKAGIWYLPLKGAILKDLYPRYGMRQMADNDILFDASRAADVKRIMTGLGFTVEDYNHGNHDVYYKKPVSNFEMHKTFFSAALKAPSLYRYYRDVRKFLVKDPENAYGYHLTDEDFYLFMIAHEYKHYLEGGAGLRSLLDTYVYLQKKGDTLDWDYITGEIQEMGIREYEERTRKLAQDLFEGKGKELSSAEQELLEHVISSGTYGTLEHAVDMQIREKGRKGFFFSQLTLPMEVMKLNYPVLRKVPALYPFFWVYRLISRLFIHPRKYVYEVKEALGVGKKKK